MPRIDERTKLQRLERLVLLLSRHSKGLTEAELAEEMGFGRRSINNYLRDLEYEGKAFKDGLYWYPLKLRESRLRPFDLSPEEAVTIYLGTRLLVKLHDKRNEPAETALFKLAEVLKSDAGVGDEIFQAAHELTKRPQEDDFPFVFRNVVRGYLYRKKIELMYKPLNWNNAFKTIFSTYLLEPSPIGYTTYMIGYSDAAKALRAYKLERIQSVRLTREEYAIPPDFPGLEILNDAWSIVFGEETVHVVARFSPRARERVLETRWHPSQQTDDDNEKPGWLRWQVQVADTLDLVPFLRSWGPDVEVLVPDELREKFEKEAIKIINLYQVGDRVNKPIAHLRKIDGEPQYLEEHLFGVSKFAGQFADKIGLKDVGEVLGLFHDVGKASQEFQNYICSATGLINPDADGYLDYQAMKGKIDHSSAGAQLLYRSLSPQGKEGVLTAQILSLCVASHHSGLIDLLAPNGDDIFSKRINKLEEFTNMSEAYENLSESTTAILNEKIKDKKATLQLIEKIRSIQKDYDSAETILFKQGLLVRFLFSCLIDADRLDTANFEFPPSVRFRNQGQYQSWEVLNGRLNAKLKEFEAGSDCKDTINQIRRDVSDACLKFSTRSKGIYRLSVPTGGGKTLASLRFALNHASHHQMDRVFYIIPYTSIIDQNAEEVRKILEERSEGGDLIHQTVLEHHSNILPENETYRQKLLSENWDAPIVFTTQVRFLETLFGSGTRNARRMHQLANSIIIFDEVQTIPVRSVHLFNLALRFLVEDCGATVVLCTATQPLLDEVEPQSRAISLPDENKIIRDEKRLYEQLKRVQVFDKRKPGGWGVGEVATLALEQLNEKGSVLTIVNTRRSAHDLFVAVQGKNAGLVRHLSTKMCSAHRLDVLEEIKTALDDCQPVICVSTQLIEAGVDIDFGVVIRYMAGLDSITQASGRCNRHGKQDELGKVFVVNPAEERVGALVDIKEGIESADRVFREYKDRPEKYDHDILGLGAIKQYYQYYFFRRKENMKYPVGPNSIVGQSDNLFNLFSTNRVAVHEYARVNKTAPQFPLVQSFKTAAKAFHAIDSLTRGVIVPYKAGVGIINDLCSVVELPDQYTLIKKAQRYVVNMFPNEFERMVGRGAVMETQPGMGVYYLDSQFYDEQLGWVKEVVKKMDTLIH
jgi:CRISPR-associated endonuclease/helicase Cas3